MSESKFNMGFNAQEMQETQREIEIEVTALGPILEGEGAIASRLVEQEYRDYGEALKQSVVRVSEFGYTGCIDGRRTLHMADGTAPLMMLRKAGAALSPFMMLGLGDVNFQRAIKNGAASPEDLYRAIEELQRATGRRPSAHFGCGAGDGAPEHADAVGDLRLDGPTATAVISLLAGKGADEHHARQLVGSSIGIAHDFGAILRDNSWNGKDFVDRSAEIDPRGVEVLETDDSPLHGHDEQALALVDSDLENPEYSISKEMLAELTGTEAFVVNLDEIRRDARLHSTTPEQALQLAAAGYLYHAGGVYKKLAKNLPAFYLDIRSIAA